MDQNHDFSALRNLLALKREEMHADTQVEQFLTEFHRRQRAQLFVRQSVFARATGWIKERVAGFELAPTLSYASVAAAIAIVAFVGLSQQVQVTAVGGQSHLSFKMPGHDTAFAMVPALTPTAVPTPSPKLNDTPSFTSAAHDTSATRYVLANNSHGAYDATVAF